MAGGEGGGRGRSDGRRGGGGGGGREEGVMEENVIPLVCCSYPPSWSAHPASLPCCSRSEWLLPG